MCSWSSPASGPKKRPTTRARTTAGADSLGGLEQVVVHSDHCAALQLRHTEAEPENEEDRHFVRRRPSASDSVGRVSLQPQSLQKFLRQGPGEDHMALDRSARV
jgi:hypothetical protein